MESMYGQRTAGRASATHTAPFFHAGEAGQQESSPTAIFTLLQRFLTPLIEGGCLSDLQTITKNGEGKTVHG